MSRIRKTLGVVGAAMAVSFGALSAAHASESVISAIAACKAIADDRQRLQCLDAAVAAVEAATTAPDESDQRSLARIQKEREEELARREGDLKRREAVLETRSESAENAVSLFGVTLSSPRIDSFTTAAASLPRENVERATDGAVEAITANVRKWSYDSRGQITVVLDNGQVWRQADSSEIYLATDLKKPHRVRIFRGTLGGFTMTVDDKNKGHKMRRIGPAAG